MLIGRTDEVVGVCRHLRDVGPVIIGGVAGVGKSALLDTCLNRLRDHDGFEIVRVAGVAGGQSFPLAALAHLLDTEVSSHDELGSGAEATHITRLISRLTSHPGTGLIVAVDDLPYVDDLSMHVIATAHATGRVRLVATARSTHQLPDRADTFGRPPGWHLALAPLTRSHTAEVAAATLGGPVAEATVERIHEACQGVPLQIGELLRTARQDGAFEQRQGLWSWVDTAAVDTRLDVLLGLRVDSLTDVEQAALETLCTVEHLPIGALEQIHPGVDVATMERARTVRASTRTGWLVPGHPLLRDVVVARMQPLRRHLTVRRLLTHWRNDPPPDTDLQRRRVLLACEYDEPVDADDVVHWAVWSRHHNTGASMLPVAERAWRERPGVDTGLAVAAAYTQLARFADADRVLRDATALADDDRHRVNIAVAHIDVLRHGLGDLDGADSVLHAASTAAASEAERLNIAAVAANDQLLLGSFAETIRLWQQAVGSAENTGDAARPDTVDSLDDGMYRLTQPAIIALATGGRVDEAAHAYERNKQLRPISGHRHPMVATTADVWWAASTTLAGAGQRSIDLITRSWADSVRDDNSWLRPVWALPYSMHCWLAGDLEAADRLAREALGVLPGLDEVRALAGYALIRVQLLRGLTEEAAVTAAEVIGDGSQSFQAHATWVRSARSQLRLAEALSRPQRAAEIAAMIEHAASAAALGQVVPAAYLLHDAMRMSPDVDVADRLARLAVDADAPVVHVIAQHADRRAAGDSGGLVRVGEWAERVGMRVLGLAATDDAVRLAVGGAARSAAMSAQHRLRSGCTGLAEEADRASSSPAQALGLTPREYRVAVAAARGLTDREIAEQFVVSVRTVNTQLRSVYAKLGIDGRRVLRHIPALTGDQQ
jgi:DNA-binding NarL/FixJ family response regulator